MESPHVLSGGAPLYPSEAKLSGIGGDLFFANAHRIFVTGPNTLS
jgi:hypothetical protein